MTTAAEQAFLHDFGKLLLQSQADPRQPTSDPAVEAFARHLRAARAQAGLTRAAVAARTGLTPALLVALELAALPAETLTWPQLTALARALGEEVALFALLLERALPEPAPASPVERLRRAWGNLAAYLGSPAQAWAALALSALALGSAVLAAALGVTAASPPPLPASALAGVFRWLRTLTRLTGPPRWELGPTLDLAPLSFVGVLLLMLAWLLLARQDLPARWIQRLHQRPNLIVNGSAVLVLVLLLAATLSVSAPATASPSSASLRDMHRTAAVGPPRSQSETTMNGLITDNSVGAFVFDSAEGAPTTLVFRSVESRELAVEPSRLVRIPTNEHRSLPEPARAPSNLTRSLLIAQALCVGLLSALVGRVTQRVGRLRRVFGRDHWASPARRR